MWDASVISVIADPTARKKSVLLELMCLEPMEMPKDVTAQDADYVVIAQVSASVSQDTMEIGASIRLS